MVASDAGEQVPDFGGGCEFFILYDGPQKIAEDVPGGFNGFVGIVGIFAGGAFTPAGCAVGVEFEQKNAAQRSFAEAGLERRDQWHVDFAQSDFMQAHGAGAFGVPPLVLSLRILPGGILADAGPRWKRRVPECSPQFRRGVQRSSRCNLDAKVCGSGRASRIAGAWRMRGSRLSPRRDLRAARSIVQQR